MTVQTAPKRRIISLVTAFAVAVASAAGVTALAQEGSPPAPQEKRVLGAVHTDMVSAFVDDGRLTAQTMADVDGQVGKRLESESLIFNLAGGQTQVPDVPTYAFLGEPGQTIWMAPQTQDHSLIWPGFSTQAPSLLDAIGFSGVVDVDLTGFHGPSADAYMEVFLQGMFGPTRVYSTRDGITEWQQNANQHTHVNWVFSQPGRYVLTFTLTTIVNGEQQSASNDYIFYVGDIADYPTVTTTTALKAPAGRIAPGAPVELSATVSPSNAEGYVQFFDGSTSLGWEYVSGGTAVLSDVQLAEGTHEITAQFTPRWVQEFATSVSAAAQVEVGEGNIVATELPSIVGTAEVGERLTVRTGTWDPEPDAIAVQWLRDGQPISGATDVVYVVAAADAGHTISARVTATLEGYRPGTATTSGLQIALQSFEYVVVGIVGTATVGKELTTDAATSPVADSLTYQWFREGEPITGATAATYTPVASDVGAALTVTVTATKAGFAPATSQPSNAVTVQAAPGPVPTVTPAPTPTTSPTPTPAPTASPTPAPTDSPKPSPTDSPKPQPTDSPKPQPTQSGKPNPGGLPVTGSDAPLGVYATIAALLTVAGIGLMVRRRSVGAEATE